LKCSSPTHPTAIPYGAHSSGINCFKIENKYRFLNMKYTKKKVITRKFSISGQVEEQSSN